MIYVLGYTKKEVNYLAVILTIIICFIIAYFFQNDLFAGKQYQNLDNSINIATRMHFRNAGMVVTLPIQNTKEKVSLENIYKTVVAKEKERVAKIEKIEKETKKQVMREEDIGNWRIEIPILQLEAPIQEGTTQNVLAEAVGHFEESKIWEGNVALAGHNRGYQCNFFQEIKELKKGDTIIYKTPKGERKYKVVLNTIIKETNWDYIENTNDNRITLITCEKDKREYRRCIQGIETKS